MKRCPECRREYSDETLNFCLDDGSSLLDGPASVDEPATAVFGVSPPVSFANEKPTQVFEVAPTRRPERGTPNATARGSQTTSGRRWDKRSLIAFVALGLVVLAGFFGYRYFGSTGGGQISSIAVLPFQNRSGDPNAEYLSDGLAESLIYRLSKLPNLQVSPTSSVIK